MAYTVTERTAEIGIRMALGAGRADVIRLFMGRGLLLVLVGVVAGAITSVQVMPLMRGLLFGVGPFDPLTLIAAPAVLLLSAVAACWIPADRAARAGLMAALRYE